MPKILFDVREKLLQAARKSLKENGYQALSVREIARTCGIGTGTVYNYFHSKDELLALVILEDWDDTLKNIDAATALADNSSDGMKSSMMSSLVSKELPRIRMTCMMGRPSLRSCSMIPMRQYVMMATWI